jgi:hypothetical protein
VEIRKLSKKKPTRTERARTERARKKSRHRTRRKRHNTRRTRKKRRNAKRAGAPEGSAARPLALVSQRLCSTCQKRVIATSCNFRINVLRTYPIKNIAAR